MATRRKKTTRNKRCGSLSRRAFIPPVPIIGETTCPRSSKRSTMPKPRWPDSTNSVSEVPGTLHCLYTAVSSSTKQRIARGIVFPERGT